MPTASARKIATGFLALVALTECLIVLGALVRAHEAGLACPDWPLCFGEFVPAFDLRVAFEWSHRLLAGSMSLCFAALAFAAWRSGVSREIGKGGVQQAAVNAAVADAMKDLPARTAD
jgi:heme A synthase